MLGHPHLPTVMVSQSTFPELGSQPLTPLTRGHLQPRSHLAIQMLGTVYMGRRGTYGLSDVRKLRPRPKVGFTWSQGDRKWLSQDRSPNLLTLNPLLVLLPTV